MDCEGCVTLNRVGRCGDTGLKPSQITNCTSKMTKEEVQALQKKGKTSEQL